MSQPKASAIIRALMYRWLDVHVATVLPNYTPASWWECDVFEITKSGYFREYEVKISRHDFLRDRDKTVEKWNGWDQPKTVENKHELLARGDPRGPKQFYYVAPAGMLSHSDLPVFAGLIEVKPDLWFAEAKVAPRLHGQKIETKVRDWVGRTCYWRMHNLLRESAGQLISPQPDPQPQEASA